MISGGLALWCADGSDEIGMELPLFGTKTLSVSLDFACVSPDDDESLHSRRESSTMLEALLDELARLYG